MPNILLKTIFISISLLICNFASANDQCIILTSTANCESWKNAIPESDGTKFVSINGEGIPFYLEKSSVRSDCQPLTRATYSKSFGCFNKSALKVGKNIFSMGVSWRGYNDAPNLGNASVSFTIYGTELCNLYFNPGTKSTQECSYEKEMSLEQIDPKLASDINSGEQNNSNDKQKLLKLMDRYEEKKKEYEKLKTCLARISQLSLQDMTTDTCGVPDIKMAIADANKAIDTIKNEILAEKNNVRKKYEDISNSVKKELESYGINPEDPSFYNDIIGGISIPDVPLPKEPSGPQFDVTNDIYAKYASDVSSQLEKSLAENDRFSFLLIAESWSRQSTITIDLISSRAVLIDGEMEAFLRASKQVENLLSQQIDIEEFKQGDIWFKDSPIPKSFKNSVKNDFGKQDKNLAREIQRSVIMWRGIEISPQQAALIASMEALGKVFSKLPNFAEYVQKDLKNKLNNAIHGAKSAAIEIGKIGVSVSPAGDYIDMCEATTGWEFCNPNGKKLSIGEQALSGVGLIIGSGKLWRAVASEVKVIKGAERFEEVVNGAMKIEESAMKIGLKSTEDIKKNAGLIERWAQHYKPTKIEDATIANLRHGEPAYLSGTKVIEFETQAAEVFHRVHGPQNKSRSWMLRKKDIEGLSPQKIKEKFNLPEVPTLISEVHVPPGTSVATGIIGPNSFGNSKGATQYELLVRIDETLFKNTIPL